MKRVFLILISLLLVAMPSRAQENGPVIIPELIQKMALSFPLAERLDIKWDTASPEDVGRYMGLLAAASEAATTIAAKNGRTIPIEVDYQAAFAAFCLWPPNKPPLIEPQWNAAVAAFGSQQARDLIKAGVGPLAIALPAAIESGKGADAVITTWPQNMIDYGNQVLDLKGLIDDQ